jgi:hypothetical protein
MKKTLLFIAAIVSGFAAYSQSVVLGISPVAIEGSYEHSWATPTGGWATPDFSIPNTYVQGELMLVEDGVAGTNADGHPNSQQGCNPLINDLTGKIAVLYRGGCEFGLKAFNAQTAGALGVIVINRDPAVIDMGPGADGANVTIPAVMLTTLDGAALVAEMGNGPVVVFIGNKVGQFANDAALYSDGVLISKSSGVLSQLAQNDTEFSFNIGAQVFNDGSAVQNNVIVNAKVTDPAGAEVYNETVTVLSLLPADSVYLYPGEAQSFPDFSLTSYPAGRYTLTYTVGLEVNDEFPSDNVYSSDFVVNDSLFTYSALNTVNNLPAGSGGYQPSTFTATYSICNVISDPNASRIGAEGIYFALITNAADSIDLTGEEVALNLYEWGDVFTDLNDAALAFDALTPIAFGYYYYPSNLADSIVYGSFTTPVVLEDNKRYLACAQTVNLNVYFRYDTDIDYTSNVNSYLQPLYPVDADGVYSAGGFGSDNAPSMAVKVFNAAELGVSEASMIEGVAYPNPAVDNVTVSMKAEGNANITMTDVAGRVVLSKTANLVNGKTDLNIAALNAGVYVVNVVLENGKTAQFNVVKK